LWPPEGNHKGCPYRGASGSQIQHVNVSPESYVVGKVPAVVIGILIEDDVVGIPEPAVAEADIVRGNAKVEPAKPETVRTTTSETPVMARAEAAPEVSVLPGMIDMVMSIIPARVVPDPLPAAIDVRSVRVAGPVREIPVFLSGMRVAADRLRAAGWRRRVGGAWCFAFLASLTKSRKRNH
jgi:hypothetical protein